MRSQGGDTRQYPRQIGPWFGAMGSCFGKINLVAATNVVGFEENASRYPAVDIPCDQEPSCRSGSALALDAQSERYENGSFEVASFLTVGDCPVV